VVDLTSEGPLDWVHWGLYTETSLDRKATVSPLISDFTRIDASNGYSYVYQFADNYNGYGWSDGIPTQSVTNTTTGVWAYGVPTIGSGFQITAPADTTLRTLKVYVGAFGAKGTFEASLSDNSAPAYSSSSLVNMMGNGPSGVFSINYAAQSAGQTLTSKWTLSQGFRADANVTLQAAALTAVGANNPPFVSITDPTENTTFSAPAGITINADAFDPDGTISEVEFFEGTNRLGQATSSPYGFTWNNVAPGYYVLTAKATDDGGASSSSSPVEIFVNATGGVLSGMVALPPQAVDLTAEGTADWAHWGLLSSNGFDHKAGVLQQISNFTRIGTNDVQQFADNFSAYGWSDGTPTANANNTKTGVYIHGQTNGFKLTVPADTSQRTLNIYIGLYGAQGDFRAYLSDFSAPAYADTSLSNIFGNAYAVYTLDYSSASAGQTLIVEYTAKAVFDADFGNVTLQAATLAGGSVVTNSPPAVAITNPTNNTVLVAPATFTVQATASDDDGSVTQVEFFNGGSSLGMDTSNPYGASVSNLVAGSYTFSAVATDNLGATTTSSVVNISVINSATAVTLLNPTVSGSSFNFSFATQSGVSYGVQFTDSLSPINWQTLTNFTGKGTTMSVSDTLTGVQRFYRVGAQ